MAIFLFGHGRLRLTVLQSASTSTPQWELIAEAATLLD